MQASEPPQRDLRGLVVRGVGWSMASQIVIQAIALITSIAIARFLGPREVGLAVQALVFSSLALVIVDFGFGSAVIQRPRLSEADKATAFWAGMVLGIVLMLLGIGLSWPISALYGEPRVQPLFAVLSVGFLTTSLGIVQAALLTRELKFRSLQIRSMTATAISSATGISLAALGFNAWAIVGQHLAITSVSTALLWRASPWRPQATFSFSSLRDMGSYASHVFGSKFLNWGTSNVDNLLIGRYVGAASLGAYSIAFSLIITPVIRIATPLIQVFFPAFSRMRDPERVGRNWLRAIRMVALLVIPAMLGLIVVAPDFIQAAFGDRWSESVTVLQILAPVGMLQTLTIFGGPVLQALDRARTFFRFSVVLTIVTVGGFAAGLPWGINGVATAYLIVTLIMQPILVWITAQAVGLTILDWLRSIAGILQAAFAMLVAVLGARELLLATELPLTPRLILLIAVGVVVYVPLVLWRAPEVSTEIREVLKRRQAVPVASAPEGTEAAI